MTQVSAAEAKGYFRNAGFPGCESDTEELAVAAVMAAVVYKMKL